MTRARASSRFARLVAAATVLVAICAVVLMLPMATYANTVYISTVGSDTAGTGTSAHPYATVQKGVDAASFGDTVHVGPGLFFASLVLKDGVSVQGSGPALTELMGHGGAPVLSASGIGPTVTLSDMTIRHEPPDTGSGISCSNSSLRIVDNLIEDNQDSVGAGIACSDSAPTIIGNTIRGNIASDHGAGIDCSASSAPTIQDNTIEDNLANDHGAGICCDNSSPVIVGNQIVLNESSVYGGGIACNDASPTIEDNTVSQCDAMGGAGIDCEGSSSPIITRNAFSGNSAIDGSGVAVAASSTPVINNDVFANNRANDGAGIWLESNQATVVNDTFADNTIVYEPGPQPGGGGVCCVSGVNDLTKTEHVSNCVFWDNSTSFVGCVVTYSEYPGLSQAGSHDTSADPLFADPPVGDYHLQAGSPCINDATATGAPAVDRDGIARPWGAGFDMGAYEFYVPLFHTTTTLTVPSSPKVNKTLTLSGAVSAAGSPSSVPGQVVLTFTRKVGKKWKSAGSAKVTLAGGVYSYSFKPKHKGSWHLMAAYAGKVVGPTTYTPSSATKKLTVK